MPADPWAKLERARHAELDAIELRIDAWALGAPKSDEELDRIEERLDAIQAEGHEADEVPNAVRDLHSWQAFLDAHPELDELRHADDG